MKKQNELTKGVLTTMIIAGTVSAGAESNTETTEQIEKIELAEDILQAGQENGILTVKDNGTVEINKSIFKKLEQRGILNFSKMDKSSDSFGDNGPISKSGRK